MHGGWVASNVPGTKQMNARVCTSSTYRISSLHGIAGVKRKKRPCGFTMVTSSGPSYTVTVGCEDLPPSLIGVLAR